MAIRDTSTTQLLHRRIVLAGTVSLAALLTAAAAQAQTATREVQVAQAQTAQVDEIIVTGTRVVRDGYEAPTPVSVVSAESILAQAPVNIADVVNQLPAFSGSRTPHSTNSNTGNGTVGSKTCNIIRLK